MSVRQVITQSMQRNGFGGQVRQAEPVLRDVENAAAQACETIRRAGEQAGLPREQVDQVLRDAGLLTETAGTTGGGADEAVPGWAQGLIEFARRNGYRG